MAASGDETFKLKSSEDEEEEVVDKSKSALFSEAFSSASRTGRIRKKSAKLIEMESLGHMEVDDHESDDKKPSPKANRNFIINMNQSNLTNQAIFKVKKTTDIVDSLGAINNMGSLPGNSNSILLKNIQNTHHQTGLSSIIGKTNVAANVLASLQGNTPNLIASSIPGSQIKLGGGNLYNKINNFLASTQPLSQLMPTNRMVVSSLNPGDASKQLVNLNNLNKIKIGSIVPPTNANNPNNAIVTPNTQPGSIGNISNIGKITINASQLQTLQQNGVFGKVQLKPNILAALKNLQNLQQAEQNKSQMKLPFGLLSLKSQANSKFDYQINGSQRHLKPGNLNALISLPHMQGKGSKLVSLGGYSNEFLALHGKNIGTLGRHIDERTFLSPTTGRLIKANGEEVDSNLRDMDLDGGLEATLDENGKRKFKKRPTKHTAYSLFCNSHRKNITPGLEFGQISRILGDAWTGLNQRDKMIWKKKAKKANELYYSQLSPEEAARGESRRYKNRSKKYNKKKIAEDSDYETEKIGTEVIDSAAHLKLLGESLLLLGQLLQDHVGPIAVQGSLSVLLDSLICSLGPLVCLSTNVPALSVTATTGSESGNDSKKSSKPAPVANEFVTCIKDISNRVYENIAYIMPGL